MAFSSMLAGVFLGLLVLLVTEAAAWESDTKPLGYVELFPPEDTDARWEMKELWKEKETGDFKSHFKSHSKTERAAGIQTRETRNITWSVRVNTGSEDMAGSDAGFFICINGENGTTNEVELDNEYNNFEKCRTDVFTVTLPDVGKPQSLTIRSDNAGSYPEWYLDEIAIYEEHSVDWYWFPCYCWLATDKGDGELSRTIEVDPSFFEPVDKK